MNVVPISYYLILSAILFGLGVIAFVFKRNIITIFMAIELMLNAVNLAFVAFARAHNQLDGLVFVFFVIVVAANTSMQAAPPPRFGSRGGQRWFLQLSQIRLVSSRDCGVFFGAVFMRVFSTDILGPVAEDATIGFGRGPSGCEDAFVLDRELEL